jgi:hypothetical protein
MQPEIVGLIFECDLCDWKIQSNFVAAKDADNALTKHVKKVHKKD